MPFFIKTIPPEEATGKLRELYDRDIERKGYPANTTQAFSLRPEVSEAWANLLTTIASDMDVRLYELVTTVVSAHLRCSY